MTHKTNEDSLKGLDPDQIVRKTKGGQRYFGLGPTRLDEAIRRGDIPAPFPLTASGRAVGWTGRQIIEHHRAMMQRMAASKKQTA